MGLMMIDKLPYLSQLVRISEEIKKISSSIPSKKTNGTKSQRTPEVLELSDTQVEPGSVQWVRMLVISWNDPSHENSKIPHPN